MKRSLRRRQCSPPLGGNQGEPSPLHQGEGHGNGVDPGNAAVKNSSAYGARNVSMVAAGTGEALPGPVTCGVMLLERRAL
jgi:hypothetical protein